MSESQTSTNIEVTAYQKEFQYIINSLTTFEMNLGLPSTFNRSTIEEAEKLLNIDWAEFKQEDPLDLGIYSCILADYAMVLQRVANKEKSTIQWCDRRLNTLGHDHKEFSKKLTAQKTASLLKLARVENLHFSVKNLSDKLEFLTNLKLRVLKENNNGQTKENDGGSEESDQAAH